MFYGWWVVFACFLLVVASTPAHSFGINSFVDHFIASLGVTRTAVSAIWLFASLFSAALVPVAGATIDSFGARAVCAFIAPIYVATLVSLACTHSHIQLAGSVALLRLLGADVAPLVASTTVQRWFVRYVGRASAFVALGGAVTLTAPALLSPLILWLGWRGAYMALAGVLGALLAIATGLIRDTPAKIGQHPDGVKHEGACCTGPGTSSHSMVSKQENDSTLLVADAVPPPLMASSLREAMVHPIFWCLGAQGLAFDLFWAGLNYHFADYARSIRLSTLGGDGIGGIGLVSTASLTRAYYIPLAISLNASEATFGMLATDRLTPWQRALAISLACASCAIIASTSGGAVTDARLVLFGLCYGSAAGMREALRNVVFGSLFGTRAIGRILGVQQGLTVASTGMGPVLWAVSRELAGSYAPAVRIGCLALFLSSVATCCVAAVAVRREGAAAAGVAGFLQCVRTSCTSCWASSSRRRPAVGAVRLAKAESSEAPLPPASPSSTR